MTTPGTSTHPSTPRSPRPSSRSARALPHALRGRRGASRSRCCPATVTDGGRSSGPGADEVGRRARRSTCSRCCEIAPGHRQGRRGRPRVPVPRRQRRTTPTCAWCCWSASATQRPTDLRRAGAALARAVRDRRRVATIDPGVAGDDGPRAPSWSARCSAPSGSTGAPTGRREHARSRRVVLGRLADADDAADATLRRAVAVGGAGWRARMLAHRARPTSRTRSWLAEQAATLAGERRPRGRGLGRAAARRARASAASSASARPRRPRRG